MAPSQDRQMEKLVDEALRHNKFQALENFLQRESKEDTKCQCSKQFITKLDKLFVRELGIGNVANACQVLTILNKCSGMLFFPGGGGISVMITQGLVKKWFERARKIWVDAGPSRNETLIKLAEDIFDALMVVHESCKEGTYEVTESLLSFVGKLASDARINVMIQKEAARKLNLILAKIPMELKKKNILSSQEASSVMSDLASRIIQGGDYDLQVSLMEALCRMTSPAQRNQLADRWFTMTFISSEFKKIKESEFETDCRRFLNMVNGMQGDGKSVFSYPCLEAFLDKHELLMPVDENLEAFWIDFNIGSESISFYFSVSDKDGQDGQWDTLCIAENEVHSYTVKEENGRKVLNLVLIDSVSIGSIEGSRVTIKFSSSLDILQATEKVYGRIKNRNSYKKTPSVVKTPVQVNLNSQENSQVLVLESQVSPSQRTDERESVSVRHGFPGQSLTHPTPDKNNPNQQMVTPVRMKVSKSCMYISGSVGSKQGSCSSSCVLPAVKVKPALQMMNSSEMKREFELRDLMMSRASSNMSSLNIQNEPNQKQTHAIKAQSTPAVQNVDKQQIHKGKAKAKKCRQHITVDKVIEMVQAGKQHEEDNFDKNIVPDSQPAVRKENIFSPSLWSLNSSKKRVSVSESLLSLQKDGSVSDASSLPPPQCLSPAQHAFRTLTQKQLHTQLTQRLEEVLREQQGPGGHTAQRVSEQRGSSLDPTAVAQGKDKVKVSGKATAARPAQKSSGVQDNANTTEANKQNMAQTTDSMVKMISSHYKKSAKAATPVPEAKFNIAPANRYLFNKSWCPSSTEKTAVKNSGMIKTLNQSRKQFQELDDVYAFKEDTPRVRKTAKSSETFRVDSSALSNSLNCSKSVLRPQPSEAANKNVKKNLFSDTDTENMTEISWLNSANRKPKPKVADYSRQPVKPTIPPAYTSVKSPYTPLPKPMKEQVKPKKKQKKVSEQKENKQQQSVKNVKLTGRPQRAAALTKTYKEPSDSDSQSNQSESEKPPPPKKKALGQPVKPHQAIPPQTTGRGQKREMSLWEKAKGQSEINDRKKSDKTIAQIQQIQTNDTDKECPEHLTVKKTTSVQGSARGQKESWTARLSSTMVSPPPIEKMRSNGKLATKLRSHTTPLRSLSISPIEPDSPSPEPLSPVRDIQTSLFKTAGINVAVKAPPLSITTPVSTTAKGSKQKPPAAQDELSPVHSSVTPSQPLISPTGREKCTLSSPLILPDLQEEHEGFMNRTSPAAFDRRSSISLTMSQSSHISVSNMVMSVTQLEKTPACHQEIKNERQQFKSGPTTIYKPPSSCSLSEREEDSEEDKENKPPLPSQLAKKMKPRKLFKTNDKHRPSNKGPIVKQLIKNQSSSEEEEEEEMIADDGRRKKSYQKGQNKKARETILSSNERLKGERAEDVKTVSCYMKSKCRQTIVETDTDLTQPTQEMDFISHQFSSELKRKIKNRSRKVDVYTRQSLKTFQQHIFSVGVQVHQYSSQKLEKVKQVLLSEINNLEQDDIALRSMEEELTTYWRKQTIAFHTYQEKGAKRLQNFKNTIQTDMCDSLEYEEHVLSSEMFLMKKNLKSVQEHFFKEMREEELLSVRRGLQSLFLPNASRF